MDEDILKLMKVVLAEAREVDAQAAHIRGKLKSLAEELGNVLGTFDLLDRHAMKLKQKAVTLQLAFDKQRKSTIAANSPVVPSLPLVVTPEISTSSEGEAKEHSPVDAGSSPTINEPT